MIHLGNSGGNCLSDVFKNNVERDSRVHWGVCLCEPYLYCSAHSAFAPRFRGVGARRKDAISHSFLDCALFHSFAEKRRHRGGGGGGGLPRMVAFTKSAGKYEITFVRKTTNACVFMFTEGLCARVVVLNTISCFTLRAPPR